MPTRDGAFTVLGGSMLTALGLAAMTSSSYLSNSTQLPTDTYLRLWGETYLAIILGIVVIIAGLVISSQGGKRKKWAGVVGVIASFTAGFLSLILLTTTVGINLGFGGSAQLTVSYEVLFFGSFVALFVGFPIGMFGSVGAMSEKEPEDLPAQ